MYKQTDLLSALRNSTKGQIQYDPNWHRDGKIKDILEECTSPPKITPHMKRQQGSHPNSYRISPEAEDDDDEDSSSESADEKASNRDFDNERLKYDLHNETLQVSVGFNRSSSERHVVVTKKTRLEEEEEIRRLARLSIGDRGRMYRDHSTMLERQFDQQCSHMYSRIENVIEKETKQQEKQINQCHEEIHRRQQMLQDVHTQSAKNLVKKITDVQNKQKEDEEKERKKEQEVKDKLSRLEEARRQFLQVKEQVTRTIESCSHQVGLSEAVKKYPDMMYNLSKQVESIMDDVRKSQTSSLNVDKLTDYLSKAQDILEFVMKQVEQAEKKAKQQLEQEQQKQMAEQQRKQKEQQQQIADQQLKQQQQQQQQQQLQQQQQQQPGPTSGTQDIPSPAPAGSPSQVTPAPPSKGPVILVGSVFKDTLIKYTKLVDQKSVIEAQCNVLITDSKMKKTRYDLQKAVNIPINTISPESGRHLRDKLDKINSLLAGHNVTIGDKVVSARVHEAGIHFCRNLFAKKIVSQGDTQVSNQHDSAFAFAAVAIGVWCELPVVGELLLAHFYSRCPYLAPYYVPKKDGQTQESFYSSLGYLYKDGEIEKQDQYLSRMSGLMRLYASIFVTSPPRNNASHPHGLDQAWAWLAQTITLEPRPDVTATMLHNFLEVTGHSLLKCYKKQFVKLVDHIIISYLPRIQKVTTQGSGGPVLRLEVILEKIKKREITPPKGILPPGFWLS